MSRPSPELKGNVVIGGKVEERQKLIHPLSQPGVVEVADSTVKLSESCCHTPTVIATQVTVAVTVLQQRGQRRTLVIVGPLALSSKALHLLKIKVFDGGQETAHLTKPVIRCRETVFTGTDVKSHVAYITTV